VPTRWQLVRADSLSVREWDDGGVVYDAFTGNTHLLDPLGLELLDLLRQRAWELSALVDELREALPDGLDGDDASQLLSAKLGQLARLELAAAAG
jgi:PqqD family protein of HPr-rel-A system